jgi:hypothetical protein
LSNLDNLFDAAPYYVASKFEIENFSNTRSPAFARYVIDTVNRIRKISSDLEQEMSKFQRQCLEEEQSSLTKVLESYDPADLISAVENWQEFEEDYWVDHLGKIAAIELITYGKPTIETMTKMVKLPEALYIKATQVCVQLANAIRATTVLAEEEIGVFDESTMPQQSTQTYYPDPEIKSLKLTKVK